MLDRIRIVLVEPRHPGNIGSAARAMKTMGIEQLVLVAPARFPDPQADWRAAGAVDVLDGASSWSAALLRPLQNVTLWWAQVLVRGTFPGRW